jgi:hypothetical protein
MSPAPLLPDLVATPGVLCPFCTSQRCVSVTMTTSMYVIVCTECKAQGPLAPTMQEAWEAWGWRGQRTWGMCPACNHWFRLRRPEQETCNGNCQRRLRTWRRKRAEAALLAEAEGIVQQMPPGGRLP